MVSEYSSAALVGYAMTYESLHSSQQKHGMPCSDDEFSPLLSHLQERLRTTLYLVQFLASPRKHGFRVEIPLMICVFISWGDCFYDFSELMDLSVPEIFVQTIPKLFETKGKLR